MSRVQIDRSNFRVIEKYVFIDEVRYRVNIVGTNIVFNVHAHSDEEAIDKAVELAEKVGLSNEKIDELRRFIKSKVKQQ